MNILKLIVEEFSGILKESGKELFVYGTLKNPKTREKVIGHQVKSKPADVNHEKVSNYKSYPNLEKGTKDINGDELVVSKDDIKKLDKWEERYDRKKMKLSNGDDTFVYILKKKFRK